MNDPTPPRASDPDLSSPQAANNASADHRDANHVDAHHPDAGRRGGGLPRLSEHEKAVYEWQMSVPGFGEEGQERLKDSSVLITRCGGLGSVVAYELAAAGVGRLVLAHGGVVKASDLNRQILMTHESLGQSRVETARRRLLEFNPRLEIEAVAENVGAHNADRLVQSVDLVVDCAPLFEERFALNDASLRHRRPMVECAMYELEGQITTFRPGSTPCLACLYPRQPSAWKRQFPVFGAVSGTVGCVAAMEAIKVLSGFGEALYGRMLVYDLRAVSFRILKLARRSDCPSCATL